MSFRTALAMILATQFVAVDFVSASTGSDSSRINPLLGETGLRTEGVLQVGQWFKLNKSVNLGVLEREGSNDNVNVGHQLGLVAGTEISIEEISADKRFVLIGIDEDLDEPLGDDPKAPTLAWVDAALLSYAGLSLVTAEAFEAEGLSMFADQDAEPQYTSVEEARRGGGSRGRRRGGRGRGGMTYCLRDVRLTASRHTSSDNIPKNIPMASRAYAAYHAEGWTPVQYSPANPVGTACFQQGGRPCPTKQNRNEKCGHAAIKIGPNRWKGAGIRPEPFLKSKPGKVYHTPRCLVPPGK